MNDRDLNHRNRKIAQASIPGDPFPWEPDPKGIPDAEEPGVHEDPADYDLGGGD
jgi:hypothetical protein